MSEPDVIAEAGFASSVIIFFCMRIVKIGNWTHRGMLGVLCPKSKLLTCLGLLSSPAPPSDWTCCSLQAFVHHFCKFLIGLLGNIMSVAWSLSKPSAFCCLDHGKRDVISFELPKFLQPSPCLVSHRFPSCRFVTRTSTSGNTAGCDPHGNRKLLKPKAGPAPGKPGQPWFSRAHPCSPPSTPRAPPPSLGRAASPRRALSALLNGVQGPAWSHPAPADSLFGAAPWSWPSSCAGGRYEILAVTESRCIIGKPSGHERANSHIPGWDGERFTLGARSPRPAPGRLPTSPAPSALIVVLMALLFEADPLAYRGECHYVVF